MTSTFVIIISYDKNACQGVVNIISLTQHTQIIETPSNTSGAAQNRDNLIDRLLEKGDEVLLNSSINFDEAIILVNTDEFGGAE